MIKEQRRDFEEFTPQNITEKNIRMMQEQGMDIHKNEVDLIDDPDDRQRVYKMKTRTKYVFLK